MTERARKREQRKTIQTLHCYLGSLQEPSWLYQLLPKCPPTGRRLLKDSRFLCNISSGSFPKFLLHDFLWLSHLGKPECLSFSMREGKEVFFSNCLALGFASAAGSARPFAGCLPLSSRSRHPKQVGSGFQRTRLGEGRKVQHQTWGVPCPSTEEEPKISPSLQL